MLPEAIELVVVTPERQLLRESVVEVQLPGAEGCLGVLPGHAPLMTELGVGELSYRTANMSHTRSEEHTSELQSRRDLVWRLLLEKKKISVGLLASGVGFAVAWPRPCGEGGRASSSPWCASRVLLPAAASGVSWGGVSGWLVSVCR